MNPHGFFCLSSVRDGLRTKLTLELKRLAGMRASSVVQRYEEGELMSYRELRSRYGEAAIGS